MPTGYTDDIIKGKITTFEDFAKKCIRAMGAAIHLRDEPIDAPYTPRKISDYHLKAIETARKEIAKIEATSDEEFLERETKRLENEIKSYEKTIKKIAVQLERLNKMLNKAKEWEPPTPEHIGFKDFIIDQLETTIKYDGNTSFYEEGIKELKEKLQNLIDNPTDALSIMRSQSYAQQMKNISYHQKEHSEEVERVTKSNLWAQKVFDSLDKKPEMV